MPDHWQETTLGVVSEIIVGPAFKSEVYRSCDDGIPLVRGMNLGPDGLRWDETFCWPESDLKGYERYLLEAGQTIVAMDATFTSKGSIRAGVVESIHLPLLLNQRVASISAGSEILDAFVYLIIRSNGLRTFLSNRQTGAFAPHISKKDLTGFPFSLPPLEEQRRIVDLVGSIDFYIDSVETQIETTRTARSALLSELLSNPGDDWQESTLGDVASWASGKSLPASNRREDGVFPVLGASGEISRTDDWLIDCDAVLVGRVGAVGAIQRTSGRVWVSDNALIAQPSSLVDVDFLHVLLECFDFTPIVSGNAQPVITQGRLRSQATSVPPLVEQRRIVNLVGSFDEQISSLESQVESVRTFRQSVLSELLSGERLLDESYDVAVGL